MEDRSIFTFDERQSDSPFVDVVWHTQSAVEQSFISVAEARWGIIVTKQHGKTSLTVRGPETWAMPAPIPKDAEFFGINFKLGTFMPHLPASKLVDSAVDLPDTTSKTFYLEGSAWEIPTFENADAFVEKLVREGLVVHEPLVASVLQGQPQPLTIRSVRRRFLQATGLTHGIVYQIERAQQALALLRQGVPILDTVDQAGYFDQPHLTKALRRFMGQTPAQIVNKTK